MRAISVATKGWISSAGIEVATRGIISRILRVEELLKFVAVLEERFLISSSLEQSFSIKGRFEELFSMRSLLEKGKSMLSLLEEKLKIKAKEKDE